MKILLDENITHKSIAVLEKYGHDVIHVLNRFEAGKSDKDVFQLALEEQRALIKDKGDSIKNTYFNVKKKEDSYEIIQRFPKTAKMLVRL